MVSILKEADAGLPVNEVWRKHGSSSATYYKWKAKYGGLDVSELKRVNELEAENSKLKRMYAELALENEAIKAVGITLRYIQPGKPNQNAYIERYNRSYRTEVPERLGYSNHSTRLVKLRATGSGRTTKNGPRRVGKPAPGRLSRAADCPRKVYF